MNILRVLNVVIDNKNSHFYAVTLDIAIIKLDFLGNVLFVTKI